MSFINPSQVFIGEKLDSRDAALRFVSRKAAELGFADSADIAYEAFLVREAEGVTGLQWGFAIPHAKSEVIHKAGVIVLKMKEPVEWPSFDNQPVDIAIALLVPDGQAGTTHLQLLSKTALMLMDDDFRSFLRQNNDKAQISAEMNKRLEA